VRQPPRGGVAGWDRHHGIVPAVPTGLCASCLHQYLVHTTRGSTFSRCERSKVDAAYPKYPRLPVLQCAGWEARGGPGAGAAER
jgi:hypothetical protein